MHDPLTQAFEIFGVRGLYYRWKRNRAYKKNDGSFIKSKYVSPIAVIWHVDPQTDGSDNSCDWFGSHRSRENGWYPVHIDNYERLSDDAKQAVDFIWYQ